MNINYINVNIIMKIDQKLVRKDVLRDKTQQILYNYNILTRKL